MVIAIDGTSSSGKSTVSRALGSHLKCKVIGTGSIYRAVASKMLYLNVDIKNLEHVKQVLDTTNIKTEFKDGKTKIYVDGVLQESKVLNSHEVSVFVSKVAILPIVRAFVKSIQYNEANNSDVIIVEGRDIGSVVFPNAEIKLYIDADLKTRASRRLEDYKRQGKNYTLEQVMQELDERDNQDRNRAISPLIMTSDAIIIDTSNQDVVTIIKKIDAIIKEKLSSK